MLVFNINEILISEIEEKIKDQVEIASEFSMASPIPEIKEIYTDVWANGGSEWHN